MVLILETSKTNEQLVQQLEKFQQENLNFEQNLQRINWH